MGTIYIIERDTAPITRAMVLEQFPEAIVSDDDIAEGKTPTTIGTDLGIECDGEYAWISFYNENVCRLNTYGRNGDGAVDFFGDVFSVQMICEHNDEFSYHEFPVDVKTAVPYAEKDGWQVFECEGYVYLYNKPNNSFYIHLERGIADFNIDEMIEEAQDC
jgi:hypothetical protein